MAARTELPNALLRRITDAGYYPELVADTLDLAVGGEPVRSFFVHAETTFDLDTVRRHLTALVLTSSRLVFVHADDHGGDDEHGEVPHAVATTESVALEAIRAVGVTHVVANPQRYRAGKFGREINLLINWGGVQRLDLEQASCGDPNCDADHGYTGALMGDDLPLRISADAEGADAVSDAIAFARELSAAVAAR
ncbi:DUF5998 family protein [Nakamurella aerolata]|uniref:Phosphodiesterase n=1 Tax=Nakamurella aerolata TaxID=1656892 RepID=A0A849A6R7_9ACTN|nr:DUF5998 family protein [Nakamurella aerolata]NNG36205.1 phosphodiesterase [Nakamurella aerolata]